MDSVISLLGVPLGYVMGVCFELIKNYGLSILLFTLITKIILLPIGVWVHKNAIKMVRMQPDINFIKARFFGDADQIAEEQSKLYKKEKYNPLLSLIPLAIQIILLMGLVLALMSILIVIISGLTAAMEQPSKGTSEAFSKSSDLNELQPDRKPYPGSYEHEQ